MQPSEAIERALIVYREGPDRTDQEILQELIRRGFDALLAEQIVEFVPLAYFRAMMRRPVRFCDYYVRMGEGGIVSPQHKFVDEPVYVAAIEAARAELAAGMPRETYLVVADRSGEAAAMRDLVDQGGSLANAVCAPPVLLRWDEKDPVCQQWDPVARVAVDVTTRKWWQFWK